jgi:hypothetical protein
LAPTYSTKSEISVPVFRGTGLTKNSFSVIPVGYEN